MTAGALTMTTTTSPARRDAGFSLLEMLVAVTLVGMIGVMAAGGVRFGAAAWERTADLGDTTVETRVAQKFLARLISGASSIWVRRGRLTPPVLFDGGPDRLEFAGPLPARMAPIGDHLLSLERATLEGGEPALVLRWSPLGAARPATPPDAPFETLFAGVEEVSFRYYGPNPETGAAEWASSWRDRDRLPDLVELRARWPEADGRVSAPVIARLTVQEER